MQKQVHFAMFLKGPGTCKAKSHLQSKQKIKCAHNPQRESNQTFVPFPDSLQVIEANPTSNILKCLLQIESNAHSSPDFK
jgi:hypothetical protein